MSSKSDPNGRRSRPWSLGARLTVWYAVSAFALVTIVTGLLYWTLVDSLDRQDDRFLANNIQVLHGLLRNPSGGMAALRQEVAWEFAFRQYAEVYVRILDDQGRVVVETPEMDQELTPDMFPLATSDAQEPGPGRDLVSRRGKPFRVLTSHAVGPSNQTGFVIQVALSNTDEEGPLAKYEHRLWVAVSVASLACAMVGYQIARRGMRPVQEISDAARRVQLATLHERIQTAGLPAELFTLAETFNQMLSRLEESFSRLSQFSANIAHELRTPINNPRGQAEVALGRTRSSEEYRDVLSSGLEECVRLSRTIDRLLFLAKSENPQMHIARERVDLGQELTTVRDFYEAAASQAGVTLTVQQDGAPRIAEVDRSLFQRAIGNLVENALAHTPHGGTISLSVSDEDRGVQVVIRDTGCGIASEHLPYLFDRFYRVDPARSSEHGGTGLGLAIVKSILMLHGGSATITSTVGQGTRVTLTFPRASHLTVLAA